MILVSFRLTLGGCHSRIFGVSQPLVSVIIPLYNRKHLISRCVESVCGQTYTNLEIIVVDDGSTDEPDEVLAELAKDTRVKVLRKPNGGVSSARNMGLDSASGELVMFVDSDDYILPDAVELPVREMTEKHVDCVTFTSARACNKLSVQFPRKPDCRLCQKDVDCFGIAAERGIPAAPWSRLYKRDVIGSLRFPLGISVGEDFIFSLGYLSRCNSISMLKNPCYVYVTDDGESLVKRYYPRLWDDSIAQWEAAEAYLADHPGSKAQIALRRFLWGVYINCIRKLCLRSPFSYREKVNILKKWGHSVFFQHLEPKLCPSVLDCRCARLRLNWLLPAVVSLCARKTFWVRKIGRRLKH